MQADKIPETPNLRIKDYMSKFEAEKNQLIDPEMTNKAFGVS